LFLETVRKLPLQDAIMKLAVCTIALRDKGAKDAFEIIGALGYKWADVLAYGDDAHISRAISGEELDERLRFADKCGVSIFSLAGYVGAGFSSPETTERQNEIGRVKAEIDLAAQIGASIIRITPGRGESLAEICDAVVPCLEEITAYAELKGVTMGIENHANSISAHPIQVVEVCDLIASPRLGIIYEPCNLMGLGHDYRKAFELQKNHIVHVHLKDGRMVDLGEDHKPRRAMRNTLFGEGDIDMQWILENLTSIDYKGWCSVEYESWHTEHNLPPVKEGLAACKKYLQQQAQGA